MIRSSQGDFPCFRIDWHSGRLALRASSRLPRAATWRRGRRSRRPRLLRPPHPKHLCCPRRLYRIARFRKPKRSSEIRRLRRRRHLWRPRSRLPATAARRPEASTRSSSREAKSAQARHPSAGPAPDARSQLAGERWVDDAASDAEFACNAADSRRNGDNRHHLRGHARRRSRGAGTGARPRTAAEDVGGAGGFGRFRHRSSN